MYLFLTLLCTVDLYFRVKERLRNGELMVVGDQWPVFLYRGYNYDKEDPWNGLLRSLLLVTVSPPNALDLCL
jgi:hypothetical protein